MVAWPKDVEVPLINGRLPNQKSSRLVVIFRQQAVELFDQLLVPCLARSKGDGETVGVAAHHLAGEIPDTADVDIDRGADRGRFRHLQAKANRRAALGDVGDQAFDVALAPEKAAADGQAAGLIDSEPPMSAPVR